MSFSYEELKEAVSNKLEKMAISLAPVAKSFKMARSPMMARSLKGTVGGLRTGGGVVVKGGRPMRRGRARLPGSAYVGARPGGVRQRVPTVSRPTKSVPPQSQALAQLRAMPPGQRAQAIKMVGMGRMAPQGTKLRSVAPSAQGVVRPRPEATLAKENVMGQQLARQRAAPAATTAAPGAFRQGVQERTRAMADWIKAKPEVAAGIGVGAAGLGAYGLLT